MDLKDINELERELIFILKEEYSFYQSLYIILDKQRDQIKFSRDDNLLDLYSEIERCHRRIRRSEEKVAAIRDRNPKLFKMASVLPGVKKLINSIATLIKKNVKLVDESEIYIKDRYDRIKEEMGELKNSEKILQYIGTDASPSPQFVDGKQ
ncbi:MAG: hypothetical protein P1R58_00945 [bacterium]|nr:hypothetical protein [bacterium]